MNDERRETAMGEGYIEAKAQAILEAGLEAFRNELGPEVASDEADRLWNGLEQLADGSGFTPETTLQGLGVSGFYRLTHTLGFELTRQSIADKGPGLFLDRMEMAHTISGFKLVLYNQVSVGEL